MACILIADDEATLRSVIADALQEHGYQVAVTVNSDQALRECEHAIPNLALIDLRMPGALGNLWSGIIARIASAVASHRDHCAHWVRDDGNRDCRIGRRHGGLCKCQP